RAEDRGIPRIGERAHERAAGTSRRGPGGGRPTAGRSVPHRSPELPRRGLPRVRGNQSGIPARGHRGLGGAGRSAHAEVLTPVPGTPSDRRRGRSAISGGTPRNATRSGFSDRSKVSGTFKDGRRQVEARRSASGGRKGPRAHDGPRAKVSGTF